MDARNRNEKGMSLAELMIAMGLIGVGILGSLSAFTYISRAIQNSKAHSLATNLAQEQMQIVMQKSYYEILVTTTPSYDIRASTPIAYDAGYFPPESILEGSVWYTRYTYIQAVTENSGLIQVLPPNTSDTGMRQITVSVLWQTGGPGGSWHSLVIKNIINNPNTVMSNSTVRGTVTNAVTGAAVNSALIDVAENVGWRDSSDASGNYVVRMSPGSFDLIATAQGYYPRVVPFSIAANATLTQNFALVPISTSTVRGTAWINNHLVISQVVASTGTGNIIEYVELYNPTTGPINMGTNLTYSNPDTWMALWDAAGNSQQRQLVYISTYVPAHSYYLITNTGDGGGAAAATMCSPITIAGVTVSPNACWRFVGTPNHALQCNPQIVSGCSAGSTNAGGIAVGTNGNLAWSGTGNFTKYDSVSWTGTGATPAYPTEGTAKTPGGATGIQIGEQFIRRTTTESVILSTVGNAYDSGSNSIDFLSFNPITYPPHAGGSTYVPATGTPATGAIASITDGLSAPSTATLMGTVPYAMFSVPGVATGTWSVFLDSGSASAEIANVIVSTGTGVSIPNATTSPPWPANGSYSIVLSTYGLVGTISGVVTNLFGTVISPSVVVTIGGTQRTVSATGYYAIRLATGTYTVIANQGNTNASYESQTMNNVSISLGDVTSNINFRLSQSARISGWITRDGVNSLPGVTVTATDANGIVADTQVSGTNGRFTLINLTTATYFVGPVLDPKETSSPLTRTVVLGTSNVGQTVFSTTFTVLGAMGTVTGTVKASSESIRTGVLIVVSTATMPSGPPTLSSASLTAAAYYADSSHEDGTYAIEVRGSTTTTYNVYAYYQRLSGQTVQISTGVISNVSVIPGAVTSGRNFTW